MSSQSPSGIGKPVLLAMAACCSIHLVVLTLGVASLSALAGYLGLGLVAAAAAVAGLAIFLRRLALRRGVTAGSDCCAPSISATRNR